MGNVPAPRSRRADWALGILKIAVSSLLLWLVIRRFSWQDLAGELAATRPERLILPFGIVLASNLLGAWQWGILVRASGLVVSQGRVLALYFAGLFFNNLWIGNLGGDVYKILKLGRSEGALGRVASATIVDRVVGAAALCALALVAAGASLVRGEISLPLTLVVLAFSAATLAAVGIVLHPRIGSRLEGSLQALPLPGLGLRLVRLVGYLQEYRERVWVLNGVFLVSLIVQAARVMAHYCVGLAMGWTLQGADLGKFFLVIPILGLVIALPISIGGWGVREWAGIALFAPLGRSGEEAVTLLALTATLTFAVSLLGGIAVLLGSVPWQRRAAKAP